MGWEIERSVLREVCLQVCAGAAVLTDWIRSSGLMSTIRVRKLNTFLGLWVTAAASVLAVYAGCRTELALFLFALAVGLNTVTVSGCKSSMLDIAPDYAGIVFGVSNTVANIPGFVAPSMVGALLTDYGARSEWQVVFWISAMVHLLGSLLFLWKGQDTLQHWARRGYGLQQPNRLSKL